MGQLAQVMHMDRVLEAVMEDEMALLVLEYLELPTLCMMMIVIMLVQDVLLQ